MQILDELLRAHGGMERWRSTSSFTAHVAIGGALLDLPSSDWMRDDRSPPPAVGRHVASDRPTKRNLVVTGSTRSPRLCVFYEGSESYGVYTPSRLELRGEGDRLIDAETGPVPLADVPGSLRTMRFRDLQLVGALLWNAILGPFVATFEGVRATPSWLSPETELKLEIPRSIDPVTPVRRITLGEGGLIGSVEYEGSGLGLAGTVREIHSGHWDFCGLTVASLRRFGSSGLVEKAGSLPLLDVELYDVSFE
jgi:hypothetical protein